MIIMFCVGTITGMCLTWMFVCRKIYDYDFYKDEYEKYYEKWFNLHKRACEAWHIASDCYYDENMSDISKKAALTDIFFMLNAYYGDDE